MEVGNDYLLLTLGYADRRQRCTACYYISFRLQELIKRLSLTVLIQECISVLKQVLFILYPILFITSRFVTIVTCGLFPFIYLTSAHVIIRQILAFCLRKLGFQSLTAGIVASLLAIFVLGGATPPVAYAMNPEPLNLDLRLGPPTPEPDVLEGVPVQVQIDLPPDSPQPLLEDNQRKLELQEKFASYFIHDDTENCISTLERQVFVEKGSKQHWSRMGIIRSLFSTKETTYGTYSFTIRGECHFPERPF